MLLALWVARVEPALLVVRLRCALAPFLLGAPQLPRPAAAHSNTPNPRAPQYVPQRLSLNDKHPRPQLHTFRCALFVSGVCYRFSRALRFCVLLAELYPCVEHSLRCTGCNGFACIGQRLSEAGLKALAVGRAVRNQACGRVDEHGVVNSA